MMNAATAHALSAGISPDTLVLADRPLKPGTDLEATARFGQDVWDLVPAILQVQQLKQSIHFLTVPVQYRQTAKELFFALLRNDHPHGMPNSRISTIRGRFSQVRQFLLWADKRGTASLHDLTAQDFKDYDSVIHSTKSSADNLNAKRTGARLLWLYRDKLTTDALSSDPNIAWGSPTRGRRRQTERRRGENSTARIPEQVLAPLMSWALRWVEDFADDVVQLHQEWDQLRTPTPVDSSKHRSQQEIEALVTDVLDRYRREGRKLPVSGYTNRWGETPPPPTASISQLAREAGLTPGIINTPRYRLLIQAAADELGLDDDTYLTAPIRGRIDGHPWLERVRWSDIENLGRLLQAACYIVIAYFSGMRDNEVKHMRRGCVSIWRDEDGRPVRHKVTSLAFKGEEDPAGVEATWIVNTSVSKAVQVLEALLAPSDDFLFTLPRSSRGYPKTRNNAVPASGNTRTNLALFIAWVNTYCAQRQREDTIPQVNGRTWRLQTRQFRRTLAWHIARQPGGSIAGAIQYRHHSVQMFEGYAGTSDSGFRHEVEAEQALARGEKLVDIIASPAQHRLKGPAADEAETRLAAFAGDTEFLGKIITDPKRLARHMRRHEPHIHPGQFVTCVYNPDRALCRRDGADGPSMPDCQPLKCRNVALTQENADAFIAWLQRMDRALANGILLAPYVRDRMEERRTELAEFLSANNIPTDQPEETAK